MVRNYKCVKQFHINIFIPKTNNVSHVPAIKDSETDCNYIIYFPMVCSTSFQNNLPL
jgi:hypothetical protein